MPAEIIKGSSPRLLTTCNRFEHQRQARRDIGGTRDRWRVRPGNARELLHPGPSREHVVEIETNFRMLHVSQG